MGIKPYILLLGILFACIFLSTSVQAQNNLIVEYKGASGVPNFLNICGEPDTARMTVRIPSSPETEVRENIQATLNLFQGAQFVELISAESSAGVSLISSGLNTATFSIPDLDPDNMDPVNPSKVDLVFALKADCNFIDTINTNNDALVRDRWDLSYDLDGSSLTESVLTAEYKDAFAVPYLTVSTNTNNITISSIGECFDRDIIMSNSGLSGFIDSLNYETTYGAGITVNSVAINGIDYPITKTAIGSDTLYEVTIVGAFMEQNTLGQGPGNGDQSLDPDESFTITENICVVSCDSIRSSVHNISWGCYGAACEGKTITNFVSIGAGAANPEQSNNSLSNENTGYCKDGLQSVTFTNTGNEVELNSGYGAMRDVELGIGIRLGSDFLLNVDKYEIFSVTVAGITLTTSDALIKLDQFIEFAVPVSDPTGMNGPDGLIDLDGDGFYDDLPINESVEISVGYRFNCSEANSTDDDCENSASANLVSKIFYSNSCAKRLSLENTVISPKNITPDSESSTDTDATIADETFHIQYFQKRTTTNFDKACSGGERLIVTVDLPTGITIDSAETNLFRNITNAYPLVSSTLNGTIMELVYDASHSPFIGGDYTIDLGLIADCTAAAGATSFPITFAHYCPDCDCTHTWFCGDLDGPILHANDVCNNAPPCPNGVRALDFDVSRTTLGYTDETYANKVNPDSVNTKVALSCDSVMMTIESVVGDDNISNDVGVIITYDNPEALPGLDEIFLFDGAEVEIRQTDGNIAFCTVAASAITVTAVDLNKHLDIELDDCLATLGLTLTPNDTIIFRGMFSLNPDTDTYNELFKLVPNFRGEIYHTFAGEQLSCDSYGEAFTIANTGSQFVPAQSVAFPEGCDAATLDYRVVIYADDFGIYYPNEFIPAAFTDSLRFSFDPTILDAFEDLSVEVSIPNHPIHGDAFFEIDGLDAFPNGEYLATFDTLTFIPSYNTSVTKVFTLRVNMIANCGSQTASSNGNNSFEFTPTIYYRDRIYAESFGDGSCASYMEESISNSNDGSFSFSYTTSPEFSLQAESNPNPQVIGNEVQWVIKHCNTSTESDAGLNWLALDVPDQSINIESIQYNDTNVLIDVPFTSYGGVDNNSVFAYVDPLLKISNNNVAADICNTYIITASFNECGAFPLTVRTGWNCTAYDEPDWTPLDYAPCNEDTLNLTVTTLEGALDAEVILQPGDQIDTTIVDLCDTLTYEILVKNIAVGNVFEMQNQFFLPLNGLEFIPNSFQLAYPPGSAFNAIPDPELKGVTSRGELHAYNDFSQISPFLETNGLQGFNSSVSIDSTKYVIRFQLAPTCNFVSGDQISYSFQGVSACGDSTNIEFGETLPIFIRDLPDATQFFLAEFGAASTYDISGNGTLDVSISNFPGTSTDDNDVIRVILSSGTSYTPNSIVVNTPATWIPEEPNIIIENGLSVLYWDMPEGVSETINFSFDFTGNPIPQCASDTLEFNLFTGDRYQTECGVTGEICSVYVGTTEGGEQILDLIITNGISIGINNAISTCVNNNTEEVTVTAEVTGLPTLTQDGDVTFYYDIDMNGEVDATDILLSTSTIPTGTADDFIVNETFNVTNAQLCNIIMAVEIDVFDLGACDQPTPVVISPLLQNAGLSTNYCGSPLTIGDDGCGNINTYTYQWTAIAPATNADISDLNILNPVLTVDPAIAAGTTLQYLLETTRDGCGYASIDTIEVTVLPVLTVNITTPDNSTVVCEGESLLLTSNASEPVTHQWSDGTNNLGTNPTLTVTPIAATTYTVVVTNANGCAATTSIDITVGTGVATIDAGNDVTICQGSSTPLQGTATGGNGTLSYAWTGAGLDNSNIANPNATPNATTTYTLEVTDEDGCVKSDDVIITVDADVPMATADDATLCVGTTTVLNAAGGNNYTWTEIAGNPSANTLSATNIANPTFTPTLAGTYNFEVLVAGGCADITVPVIVTVTSIDVTISTPDNSTTVCEGESLLLTANTTSTVTHQWSDGTNNLGTNPTLTITPIAATTYTVVVTDNGGCTAMASIDITTATGVATIDAGNDVTICQGSSTQLQGTATGGNGTLSYAWIGAGLDNSNIANPNATPNATTTYTLEVTDEDGCTQSDDVTITVDTDVPMATADDATLCVGTTTVLNAAGGNSYTWTEIAGNPSANTLSATNIANPTFTPTLAGTYNFEVLIAGGCADVTIPVTVEVTSIDVTISTPNNSTTVCEGESLLLTANTTSTVTHQWSDGTNNLGTNPTLTITPIAATTYSVVVTDNDGCTAMASIDITTATGVATIDAGNDVTICQGSSTALQGTATGGNGTLSYAWTGAGLDNSNIANPNATPNATTTYTLEVTDEDGCVKSDDVTITVDTDVPMATADDATLCVGLTTVLNAAGGNNYTWTEIAGNPSANTLSATNIANPTFTPTLEGTYNFEVLVAGGCADITVPVIVTVTSIEVTSPQIDLSQCDGDVQAVSITLEENIQSYTIDGGPSQNDASNGATLTFDAMYNQGANTFTIELTGVSGCTTTTTFNFTECPCNPAMIQGILVANSNCGESTGSATINISGNPADYTFTWSPNLGTPVGNGESRTDLPAGTYQVTIEEIANPGCIVISTVVVGNSDAPTPTSIVTTPATCNNNDGTATILPANWTYDWSDTGTGNVRTDLTAGIYGVTVTDPNDPSCTNVIAVTVLEDNDLMASANIITDPTCGNNDGSVEIIIPGGGNFTFIWSDGGTGAIRNDLSSGTYVVNIQEIGGNECSTSFTFALIDSDVPQAPVTINDVIDILCVDDANGIVDFTVAIPVGIANPVDTIITDGFTEWTNGTLTAGQYCIEIRDANGCVNGAACFEIEAPEPILATISTSAACDTGGSVTITTTGGTGTYTYDWADLAGTNNPKDRTNLAAGNYELNISDSNGCQMTLDGGVTVPDCPCTIEPEIESVVITEATCGNSDGEATIIVNPTSAGLDYTWFPDLGTTVGDGNIRTNLPAGGYNVTVSDPSGECFDVVIFAVNNEDGPELDAPIVTTPANCGAADGTATLSPSTFNYAWSDGGTGSTRTDLASDTYFVSISEVGNPTCFSVEEIFIGLNNDLVVTVNTITAPTCGNADGTVMATTNGSGTYNYEWSFGGTTDATQANLMAGVYDVTATDTAAPDCEATTAFLLIDGDVVGADVVINSVTDVSCAGESDGMVDFTVTPQAGFQGPETVVIENANGQFVNGTLAGGGYCIVVYDVNGCVAGGDCFTIEENEPLDAEFSISGGCGVDGSIDINITQGSGTYTFDWADLPGTNDPEDRNNLTTGIYSVTITDSDGCTISGIDLEIECDECSLDLDLVSVVIQEATCGNNDGEATINANVDLGALVFVWTPNLGTSGTTDNIRTDLPAGGYIVVATDTTGFCTDSISFVINNEDAPELDALPVIVSADCGTDNGSVTLSPNTYDYTWSDAGTGAVRTDLAAGIYFVTFTDPATPNCEGIIEIIVPINSTLEVTIDIITAPTCGNADGHISANVTNGSGNYAYSWNTGGTTMEQALLPSGTYTVEVTDLDNPDCTATATAVLPDSDVATNYTVTINDITHVSCAGAADGFVDFDVTPNSGFTTTIVGNGTIYTNGALPGGDYCINVIDATGCIAGEECFTIIESDPLEVEFSISEGCQEDGTIDLIITGGTGVYTFDWADLAGTNDPEDRTDLAIGTYSVSISDENGCLLEGLDLEVLCTNCDFEPVVTSTVIYEATCGNSDGEVTININLDPSLPVYTWLPDVGTPGITGNIRTDLPAGGYTVTVADSTGICFDIVTFAITNEDGPELDDDPVTTAADCDAANGTATLLPNTYDYTWSDMGTGDTRNDLATGVYFVTFTDPANPDCEGVVEVNIGINSTLEVEIEIITAPTCGNEDGEIAANVTGGSGNYQYAWSFGGSNMTESGLASGSYAVTVTDIDNPACTASASIVLIDSDVTNIDITIDSIANITCLGANDGFVGYTANIPAGFNVIITDGVDTYENGSLPAGELCIEITDASDCVAGGTCFTIEEPTDLDVEFSISGGCGEDGAINIITNGGTGNYTFDWLDLPGDDNIDDRTDLSTGVYSVIVSDENECAVVGLDLVIECEECEDDIIDYTIAFESVCSGFIGSAEVVVNGNTTDYSYDWTPTGIGTANADGNKLTDLPAGLYQVVVTDIASPACVDSISILVTNENGPEAIIELITPAGCGDSDGTATITPDSLTYEWSDGGVGDMRDDLAAGIYEVIYYDDEDTLCYNVLLVEIPDTSNLELEVEIISLPDCNMNNGEVNINLLSGMGELVFIWSDGGSGQSRDDLEAGTYTVIALEEASGCSTEITFTLLNNVAETATINIIDIINISCNGDGLGSIVFDVTYDPAFVQSAIVTVTDGFTAYDPDNLPVGSYCINIEDGNKCLVASECFEITETEELELSVVGTYAGCEGSGELGSFDITVTGGTMPYTFDWADLNDPNEPEDRTDLAAGIYDLTITDALGCMVIANGIGLDTFCVTDCEYFGGMDTLSMEMDCSDTLQVCTSLSYGDFLLGEYSISVDGELYDITVENVCDAELLNFYPPLAALSPGNGLIGPYIAEWTVDGVVINIGEFLTIADLVDSMSVLDLEGDWILDDLGGIAIGGSADVVYGNLVIFVANNLSESNTIGFGGTQQNAINVSIGITGEGQHEVVIVNNETLCPDTLIVNIACMKYVLYDTMTLGDSIYYCLDIVELIDSTDLMGNILTLENICPDASGTSVIFNVESEIPPCISYLGITPGTDTACLVICDDMNICDTVNYIVTVIPTGPITVMDTVLVQEQDTFCLDSLTDLCGDIVSITDFCNDGGMIVDFDTIQVDGDYCVIYEGLNLGIDSSCWQVEDEYGNFDTVIIVITVGTTSPDTICDTIFVGQIVEYCIDDSELLTGPETLVNLCQEESGEFVEFFADESTYCVTYEGVADIGTDSACIVICDSMGVCDTTYFCITVVEFFDPPIAVDDYDTTLTNVPIVINVKENDTIFGGVDSIYVINDPFVGDVTLNLDCTFTYTPDEGVCSITDSFTYVICNPNACDTATVFIYIQCTELTIFNGFSPNNDGVNDVFYIDGIEDFPNNRLCVYNRWGNKVYDKKGYNNEWFGTWSGNDLPDGTYFYVLDLGEENEGKTRIYNGYIQIHR